MAETSCLVDLSTTISDQAQIDFLSGGRAGTSSPVHGCDRMLSSLTGAEQATQVIKKLTSIRQFRIQLFIVSAFSFSNPPAIWNVTPSVRIPPTVFTLGIPTKCPHELFYKWLRFGSRERAMPVRTVSSRSRTSFGLPKRVLPCDVADGIDGVGRGVPLIETQKVARAVIAIVELVTVTGCAVPIGAGIGDARQPIVLVVPVMLTLR